MIPFAVLNSLISYVKKGFLRVNSVMILVVLSTHAELASATARGRSYWEMGELEVIFVSKSFDRGFFMLLLTPMGLNIIALKWMDSSWMCLP